MKGEFRSKKDRNGKIEKKVDWVSQEMKRDDGRS